MYLYIGDESVLGGILRQHSIWSIQTKILSSSLRLYFKILSPESYSCQRHKSGGHCWLNISYAYRPLVRCFSLYSCFHYRLVKLIISHSRIKRFPFLGYYFDCTLFQLHIILVKSRSVQRKGKQHQHGGSTNSTEEIQVSMW